MKKSKQNIPEITLDEYEQEISDALDFAVTKGKLKSIKNLKEEMALAKEAAANYSRKDARVNIRMSNVDLARIKQKAAYKG